MSTKTTDLNLPSIALDGSLTNYLTQIKKLNHFLMRMEHKGFN